MNLRRAERRDERGATLIVVGVAMTVLVVIAAFAVDLGMQRVVRRDMQAMADVVALDLARRLDGRPASQLQSVMDAARDQSVARNRDTLGGNPDVTYRLGGLREDGSFDPAVDPPTAVEVTAAGAVDFAFAPGEGAASRTAVAESHRSACLKVGSTALAVSSGDSGAINLVNGIIDEALGVDLLGAGIGVLGYKGLATADLSLLELIAVPEPAGLGVGTVDELASLDGLTIGEFNAAALEALRNQSPANTAAIEALETLSLGIGAVASTPIEIANLVGISQGDGSALGAGVNLLDAVLAEAEVANGDSAIAVNGLGLDLSPLSNLTGTLSIVNAPKWQCGPIGTEATSAQATLNLSGDLLTLPALTLPGLANVNVAAGEGLDVTLALSNALAELTRIQCTPAGTEDPDRIWADVTSGLVSASVAVPLQVSARLRLLGITVAEINVELTANVSTGQPEVNKPDQALQVPPNDTNPRKVGSGRVGLADTDVTLTDTDVDVDVVAVSSVLELLGIDLDALLDGVLSESGILGNILSNIGPVLSPVLTALDTALIGPLSELLGLEVAGADLYGRGATCGHPALRG